MFGKFFKDKIQDIRNQIVGDSMITDADPVTACIFSMFTEVSVKSVKSTIMASNSKTCPMDPFPTSLLKDCIDFLAPTITYLVNTLFSCGVFPSALKHGRVTPVLKKNGLDPEAFKNYRPITNLPFLSKVLEKCALPQMYSYLLQNDLFPASQSAYCKDNSTETALLHITNDILQANDKHEDTILVLLNLSAAFDTVDHKVLSNRLNQRFGLRDLALKWLASYLADRKQSVRIRSAVSVDSQLCFGIPQGSVLGPVLFSMYVAPVEDIVLSCGLRPMFYANDSQIYLTMELGNRNVSIGRIEDCISHIIGWYSNNFLLCNPAKTKVIYFSSKFIDKDTIPSINIGANTIKLESAICDLGVVLDNHPDMSRQVTNICKSAFLAIHNIGKIRNLVKNTYIHTYIHTYILYLFQKQTIYTVKN